MRTPGSLTETYHDASTDPYSISVPFLNQEHLDSHLYDRDHNEQEDDPHNCVIPEKFVTI